MKLFILSALSLLIMPSLTCASAPADSTRYRIAGFAADVAVGKVLKIDEYERRWMIGTNGQTFGGELRFKPAADAFSADYNMPTLGLGFRFGRYVGVKMKKEASPDYGLAQMVNYTSRMGNTATIYGFFERPLSLGRRWETDYRLDFGCGWGTHPYNKRNNVDNELIGSNLLFYLGAGLHATYFIQPQIGLRAGIEFAHHSNGALNRPNKGSNLIGPMFGVVYRKVPAWNSTSAPTKQQFQKPHWYTTVAVGFGGKTLLEEWIHTQYETPPEDPNYRKESFNVYAAVTAQADLMCRYARRWSSGLGLDLFYASAAHRIADRDRALGRDESHSPWSVGIAAKHEAWWHNLALNMALGVYLYRHMGFTARVEEKPYYERIGLKYVFPQIHGLFVGANVKAHLAKADQTEIVVGIRL